MNIGDSSTIFLSAPPSGDTSDNATTLVKGMISRRAYELFEQRGRRPGHEVEDWLQAVREVKHHLGI